MDDTGFPKQDRPGILDNCAPHRAEYWKGTIRMPYQSVNPFNEEILRTFDEHTDRQMEKILATARRTFREVWSKKFIRERADVIGKAASPKLQAWIMQ